MSLSHMILGNIHGKIIITFSVKKTPVLNSGRVNHGGVTITSGMEELPLPNFRKQVMAI